MIPPMPSSGRTAGTPWNPAAGGAFWEPVQFNTVQPDDVLPITLLFEDAGMAHSFLCVLSSDPQIVTMELDYVAGFSETSSPRSSCVPSGGRRWNTAFSFPVTVRPGCRWTIPFNPSASGVMIRSEIWCMSPRAEPLGEL